MGWNFIGYHVREVSSVVPYRGTWVETTTASNRLRFFIVVPYRGTWVETTVCIVGVDCPSSSYLIEVRGLKHTGRTDSIKHSLVVPYRGTWVETENQNQEQNQEGVVPYRGTWVETLRTRTPAEAGLSYLIEVRGLKQSWELLGGFYSPSYLIEVRGLKPGNAQQKKMIYESHPLRVRGLKLNTDGTLTTCYQSHPLRVRGLKQSIGETASNNTMSYLIEVYGLKREKHLRSFHYPVASFRGATRQYLELATVLMFYRDDCVIIIILHFIISNHVYLYIHLSTHNLLNYQFLYFTMQNRTTPPFFFTRFCIIVTM